MININSFIKDINKRLKNYGIINAYTSLLIYINKLSRKQIGTIIDKSNFLYFLLTSREGYITINGIFLNLIKYPINLNFIENTHLTPLILSLQKNFTQISKKLVLLGANLQESYNIPKTHVRQSLLRLVKSEKKSHQKILQELDKHLKSKDLTFIVSSYINNLNQPIFYPGTKKEAKPIVKINSLNKK